ncbi:lycopene cyclase family protein [Tardiphaga sp.]|uniref:lycopene cyclase family protein n=1 Tax=Tardiphaga sp. TaxID=1926292 RepID=UPI0025FDFFFE|nr:lycopene cyclase family protein [Tardiphaga sp.]
MPFDADLIVLGGGCAGLSLALRLAELGEDCPRTLIIEQRTHYTNDRTWCFWDDCCARIQPLVQHRWQKVRIRAGRRSVTVNCGATPYQMLSSGTFYAAALAKISQNPRIELLMDASVFAPPSKHAGLWHVETDTALYRGGTVIDTRPAAGGPRRGDAMLWQSFYGCEMECDDRVFDAGCADLMNFATGHTTDIRFAYILPVSANRALVEATVFGPDPLDRSALSNDLNAALARCANGSGFRILREENGVLPMGTATLKVDPDPSYLRAGVNWGGARASTGYAFQRIQRWADDCARRLAGGQPPVGHPPDSWLLRGMDHLFLSVLRTRSAAAPDLFLSMFENVDAARLIRFLGDGGTLLDRVMIASVLPVLPFLREIPAALHRSARLREAT